MLALKGVGAGREHSISSEDSTAGSGSVLSAESADVSKSGTSWNICMLCFFFPYHKPDKRMFLYEYLKFRGSSTRKLCIGHNDMLLDFIADAPSRAQYSVIGKKALSFIIVLCSW